MKENTDLVQIRPAFGGNIMAQIITKKHAPAALHRPLQDIRKTRSKYAAQRADMPHAACPQKKLASRIRVLRKIQKDRHVDISEADMIVALGRGVKSQKDLAVFAQFAEQIGAKIACTRPLIEAGWLDPRLQIGPEREDGQAQADHLSGHIRLCTVCRRP